MGGLESTIREEDSVVCYNAHWVAVDVGKSLRNELGKTLEKVRMREREERRVNLQ